MTNTILVFEDFEENYEELKRNLEEELDDSNYDFDIERFEDEESDEEATNLVKNEIEQKNPSLVILDWDLTSYSNSNVRREHVQIRCETEGIPLCIYRGNISEESDVEQYQEDKEDSYIKLDSTQSYEEIARKCSIIADGFVQILETLEDIDQDKPSSAISEVLKAPEHSMSKLDQYSWGQSKAISIAKDEDRKETKVFATFLGYWIYNQLLTFPGALLGAEAAASYLQVDTNEFKENSDMREDLRDALYRGPFSDLKNFWWKSGLDEVRARETTPEDEKLINGPELFDRLDKQIDTAECAKGHEGAGYYCIISEQPVCEEHSVRPEGWIPRGASRARISEDEYEKLQAWMPR